MAKISSYADGGTIQDSDLFVSARGGGNRRNLWSTFKSTLKTYFDTLYDPLASAGMPKGHLHGLTLSNNSGDATNDIDIAVGEARDSTDAEDMVLASALTKQLDAAWAVGTNQGGLDTGVIANTTYFVWLIKRSDTDVVDVLFSTSATSPTMPASYDYKRRIGSIVRTGGAIKGFVQDGDTFMWKVPVNDLTANNPGTAAATRTLTLPVGIRVQAILGVLASGAVSAGNPQAVFISDLSITDTAPAFNVAFSIYSFSSEVQYLQVGGTIYVFTNTSAQVRSRVAVSTADTVIYINTHGWIDTRGRLA